jgi:uncharacterized membrane protein (UPF0182 family)
MRFAWLRENAADSSTTIQGQTNKFSLIRMAYNLAFWIFLIPFLSKRIDYSFGFIAFAIVIAVRLVLNLYTNNWLKQMPEQYERFPFRP